jgi:hypothetical protein
VPKIRIYRESPAPSPVPSRKPSWPLKVVSGGQVGADIAALKIAHYFGIPTGGFIPRGFRTQQGCHPEYETLYGMEEMPTTNYKDRTFANVESSDGTARFAYDFGTPGELCTMKAIWINNKPFFDVEPADPNHPKPSQMVEWIREHNIHTLNVAGNANPRIEMFVCSFLQEVFRLLGLLDGFNGNLNPDLVSPFTKDPPGTKSTRDWDHIPFGKYSLSNGYVLKDVPTSYLKYFLRDIEDRGNGLHECVEAELWSREDR